MISTNYGIVPLTIWEINVTGALNAPVDQLYLQNNLRRILNRSRMSYFDATQNTSLHPPKHKMVDSRMYTYYQGVYYMYRFCCHHFFDTAYHKTQPFHFILIYSYLTFTSELFHYI